MTLFIQPHERTASSPIGPFMYALKSSESRRQYPRRLELFFDSVGLNGTLDEQAIEFLKRLIYEIRTSQILEIL
ncbi:MAG: hypothetical protein WAZ77_11620 [Candidatus Nitrosopolaris sp.]